MAYGKLGAAARAAALAGALALGAVSGGLAAQTPMPVPLGEYGDLPAISQGTLSQTGKRIAMITTRGEARYLIVFEPGKGAIARADVGTEKVRSVRWVGDDRVMVITSKTEKLGYGYTTDKAEFYTAIVVTLGASVDVKVIFGDRRDIPPAIFGDYGVREIDGRHYGFFGGIKLAADQRIGYRLDHTRPYLWRVDLQDFSVKQVAAPAPENHSHDWLIDAAGEIVAVLDIQQDTGAWSLRNKRIGKLASGTNPLGRIGFLGLGYDGASILLWERTEEGIEWHEVPITGGEIKPFLPDVAVGGLFFDPLNGHLIGYREKGPDGQPVMRDPAHQSAIGKVRQAFPQEDMGMLDWTRDFSHVIVRTSGNQDSGTWYAVDMARLRAEAIDYERRNIEPEQVGPISTFAYTAGDGTELDGILTLPPGREARLLPAIIMPHGGPHAHDVLGFDWWAQAYASRGYAVFQPNFRGSTNRNQAFMQAGFGEWGRKMQSDKTDGLAALVAKGIVDPARVCIVGASYGGYAALAGVTLQQGIFRCAVAVAPVSDIANMYREDVRASGERGTTRAGLLDQLGPSKGWNEVSPLRAAARADAPVMLIHGKDDIVVPYSHSTRMANALKSAGKPYELVTLDGEDHWLSRSDTRRAMLEAAVRFVEEHNPAS